MLSGLITAASQQLYSGLFQACLCRACVGLPSSAACRSAAQSPCYGSLLCPGLANQSSVATQPLQAAPFSPVLVTASIAVHRPPFAVFVWIHFLKAPETWFSFYCSPFLTHRRRHTHRNQIETLIKKPGSKTENNL